MMLVKLLNCDSLHFKCLLTIYERQMRRYCDNDGNPLHEVCEDCVLLKTDEKGKIYCGRTFCYVSLDHTCPYYVAKKLWRNYLTDKEKEILSQVASDNETGNHLLGRNRPDGYWDLRKEWVDADMTAKSERTERQAVIWEYVYQCTDYNYYKSLPSEKRMF